MTKEKPVDLNLLSETDRIEVEAIELALTNLRNSGKYNKPLWDGLVSRKRGILDFYRPQPPEPEPYEPTIEERLEAAEERIKELEERFSKLSEI